MAEVAAHYDTGGKLLPGILAGIESIGKTIETVTISDLAPVNPPAASSVTELVLRWTSSTPAARTLQPRSSGL